MDKYKEKLETEETGFKSFNAKRRSNGELYRSRSDMIDSYKKSASIYPFSVIFNLDYCFNIIKSHIKNSLIFALPLSGIVSYALNPEIRIKGLKARSLSYYLTIYGFVYISLISYFTIDALLFCDYCKPWSSIYTNLDDLEAYKDQLKNRIKREQQSSDIKYKKTITEGLKDEEL